MKKEIVYCFIFAGREHVPLLNVFKVYFSGRKAAGVTSQIF